MTLHISKCITSNQLTNKKLCPVGRNLPELGFHMHRSEGLQMLVQFQAIGAARSTILVEKEDEVVRSFAFSEEAQLVREVAVNPMLLLTNNPLYFYN